MRTNKTRRQQREYTIREGKLADYEYTLKRVTDIRPRDRTAAQQDMIRFLEGKIERVRGHLRGYGQVVEVA